MPKKNIQYYESLPYRVDLFFEPEDEAWIIRFPELPGCIAHGETREEALALGDRMKSLWLTTALSKKDHIPEPQPEPSYSGKLVLRLPRGLHEQAVQSARREETSLNTYLVQLIAEGVQRTALQAAGKFVLGMIQKHFRRLPEADAYRVWFGFGAEPIFGQNENQIPEREVAALPTSTAPEPPIKGRLVDRHAE